jgi:GMP synthase (glutamine-hydrolysing)
MALRFLVVEGNTRPARERHSAAYGITPAQSYAAVLQEIEPDILCDIAHPADEGANLPDPPASRLTMVSCSPAPPSTSTISVPR